MSSLQSVLLKWGQGDLLHVHMWSRNKISTVGLLSPTQEYTSDSRITFKREGHEIFDAFLVKNSIWAPYEQAKTRDAENVSLHTFDLQKVNLNPVRKLLVCVVVSMRTYADIVIDYADMMST